MPALYALILAGGSGSRLWPVSTPLLPKQFIALHGERTMLQQTLESLQPLIPLANTYVITFAEYIGLVESQLPSLPRDHILVEPVTCGTAAAVGLAAALIRQRARDAACEGAQEASRDAADDGIENGIENAVMVCAAADLYFGDGERYRQALRLAGEVASRGYLVTIGIEPGWPEVGYGYIERGEAIGHDGELAAFEVVAYHSKPDLAQAQAYLRSGRHIWHSGVSVWGIETILREIRRCLPEFAVHLDTAHELLGHAGDGTRSCLADSDAADGGLPERSREQTALPTVSVEAGVLQRASRGATIPLRMEWSDLGTWARIAGVQPTDEHANAAHTPASTCHVAVQTHNTFVYAAPGQTIATLGVDDLIIVQTPDALLICHRDQAGRVGELAEAVERARRARTAAQPAPYLDGGRDDGLPVTAPATQRAGGEEAS